MLIEYLYRKSIGARSSQEPSIKPLLFLSCSISRLFMCRPQFCTSSRVLRCEFVMVARIVPKIHMRRKGGGGGGGGGGAEGTIVPPLLNVWWLSPPPPPHTHTHFYY